MNKKILVHWEDQLRELSLKAVDIVPKNSLKEKLKESYENQTPLKVKFGADPSRPDLHIGHSVILHQLKKLQDFGHEIYFLIGDFTAMIGDPTGKNTTRPTLTREQVVKNSQTYQEQISKFLDLSKVKIVYNSSWFGKLSAEGLLHIISKATVHQISSREDFSKRIKEGTAIHLHEFVYPVLQGYDSVELKADLEIGGTDQLFNLLMGRDLQGAYHQKSKQTVITYPLLEGLDGTKKMSKSSNNYISVNEEVENIFGKIMSISDDLMIKYYQLLSRKEPEEIEKLLENLQDGKLHPMEAKKQLAVEVASHYYPLEIAQLERLKFEKKFSKKELLDDIKEELLPPGEHSLSSICKKLGWVNSNGEFKRLLKENAVKLDNEKQSSEIVSLKSGNSYILKVGKLRMVKIVIQ